MTLTAGCMAYSMIVDSDAVEILFQDDIHLIFLGVHPGIGYRSPESVDVAKRAQFGEGLRSDARRRLLAGQLRGR